MTTNSVAGFLVRAAEDRSGGPLRFLGESISIKVAGADTDGRFSVAEETTPPQGGPPLHLHKHEDEWLYVLEGRFLFEMDGRQIVAIAGDSVFISKGVPHTFQNIGDSPGRILGLIQPAGIERFFEKMACVCRDGTPDPQTLVPLFEQFGLEMLGPPLGARQGR